MENTIYIHYGDDIFHDMRPVVSRDFFTKPKGGLWACRKDEDEWKHWCEHEDFHTDQLSCWFTFKLRENTRVLDLNSIEQLMELPKIQPYFGGKNEICCLDFEKITEEYDAVEVSEIWKIDWALYAWDVNCILVMNPKCIELVDSSSIEGRLDIKSKNDKYHRKFIRPWDFLHDTGIDSGSWIFDDCRPGMKFWIVPKYKHGTPYDHPTHYYFDNGNGVLRQFKRMEKYGELWARVYDYRVEKPEWTMWNTWKVLD